MAVLTGNTVVRNPEDQQLVVLRVGQEVPQWAVEQVGDHLLDGNTAGTPSRNSASSTAAGNGDAAGSEGSEPPAVTEPPRAGRGSGIEAWTAYAESLDIEIPDGAGRDDIVDLVDQHRPI